MSVHMLCFVCTCSNRGLASEAQCAGAGSRGHVEPLSNAHHNSSKLQANSNYAKCVSPCILLLKPWWSAALKAVVLRLVCFVLLSGTPEAGPPMPNNRCCWVEWFCGKCNLCVNQHCPWDKRSETSNFKKERFILTSDFWGFNSWWLGPWDTTVYLYCSICQGMPVHLVAAEYQRNRKVLVSSSHKGLSFFQALHILSISPPSKTVTRASERHFQIPTSLNCKSESICLFSLSLFKVA